MEEKCKECSGQLEQYVDDEQSCSCHINPPCSKCTDTRSICVDCGEIFDNYKYVKPKHIKIDIKLPQCKVNELVDYKIQRSGCWVIASGTHKKGMTKQEVKEKLGSFDKYHMFKFKFFNDLEFKASWCTD